MKKLSISLLVSAALIFSACGDDDNVTPETDQGVTIPDTGSTTADSGGTIDPTKYGAACTPSQTAIEGDCGYGYMCLYFEGQTTGFCSLECGGQTDSTTCAQNAPTDTYPSCSVSITTQTGIIYGCAFICKYIDANGTTQIDKGCPSELTCPTVGETQPDGSVAHVCEAPQQ